MRLLRSSIFFDSVSNSIMTYRRGFVLLILAAALASQSYGQNDELITVDTSIVVMNASVTDGHGKAVRGLTQGQFRIFEDGV